MGGGPVPASTAGAGGAGLQGAIGGHAGCHGDLGSLDSQLTGGTAMMAGIVVWGHSIYNNLFIARGVYSRQLKLYLHEHNQPME